MGELLELTQEEAPPTAASFLRAALPTAGGLSAVDMPILNATASPVATQRLDWRLTPTGGRVTISDDGLAESYMIFGGPGSGKTYLLEYLLKQMFALHSDDPDRKVGALILDPKAALQEDVRTLLAMVGREDDLVVLNADAMAADGREVNIIDAGMDGNELGAMLVLAAQAAGVSASEPYWFGLWTTLFSAAVPLLSWMEPDRVVTLSGLMSAVLDVEGTTKDGRPSRKIQRLASEGRERLPQLDEDQRRDMRLAVDGVEAFFARNEDQITTVETLMRGAFSDFLRSKWQSFSYGAPNLPGIARSTFYDSIIDDGKVVLVSASPSEPNMAKIICTLTKTLFQRSVLSRLDRVRAGRLRNFERIVLLAVDEYSAVASEVPGSPVGDGMFFSQCRQNGAIGLVATQSVNLLQTSSLKDNWKAVVSVTAAKVYMRLADNETAEEASKLGGEYDWHLTSRSTSQQKDGASSSDGTELRERKALSAPILTQLLVRGQAVVVGSTDGKKTVDSLRFFQTPRWK